jgi:hypothetical protein
MSKGGGGERRKTKGLYKKGAEKERKPEDLTLRGSKMQERKKRSQ